MPSHDELHPGWIAIMQLDALYREPRTLCQRSQQPPNRLTGETAIKAREYNAELWQCLERERRLGPYPRLDHTSLGCNLLQLRLEFCLSFARTYRHWETVLEGLPRHPSLIGSHLPGRISCSTLQA
ncbi:MAG: hypothetical protein KatS3mg127_1538 [Silanimonas sp.]|nr:MAG: hypothetical protein KatS3mg127_1538 [Silanimonas sp.]